MYLKDCLKQVHKSVFLPLEAVDLEKSEEKSDPPCRNLFTQRETIVIQMCVCVVFLCLQQNMSYHHEPLRPTGSRQTDVWRLLL